jgi:hypothetical protein
MSVCALTIRGQKNRKTERPKGKPTRKLILGQIVVISFSLLTWRVMGTTTNCKMS